jgi:hypothetical protein
VTHHRNLHYLADYLVPVSVNCDLTDKSADPVFFLKGCGLIKHLFEVVKFGEDSVRKLLYRFTLRFK